MPLADKLGLINILCQFLRPSHSSFRPDVVRENKMLKLHAPRRYVREEQGAEQSYDLKTLDTGHPPLVGKFRQMPSLARDGICVLESRRSRCH